MTQIITADYWPQFFNPPIAGQHTGARFAFAATSQLPAMLMTFFYDTATKSMKLMQYDAANKWNSNWYLQKVPGFGLAEIQDDLPQNNAALKILFGSQIIERYKTPIGWGDTETVGGQYTNKPQFDLFRCTPLQSATGFQTINFEQLLPTFTTADGQIYHDVLVQLYQQSWGSGKTASGARMWMAKGIGPVANQWVSLTSKVTTDRQDATITYF